MRTTLLGLREMKRTPMASSDPRHILITGLRRSGTTILWETLRQHEATRCYDEPFHPRLTDGVRSNAKGTWNELATMLSPAGSVEPRSLCPIDELAENISVDHKQYLDSLYKSAPRVAIDLVRSWNHASDLATLSQKPVMITLIRDVQSWVQAQLLPSGRGTWRKNLADIYRRQSFFKRHGFYNNYHYQEIITASLVKDHPMWSHVSLSTTELKKQPAFVKLMAFWWCANLTTLKALAQTGQNSLVMTMNEFRGAPETHLKRIYEAAAWDTYTFDLGRIRPPNEAFRTNHLAWRKAAEKLGIPEHLLSKNADIGATLLAEISKEAK